MATIDPNIFIVVTIGLIIVAVFKILLGIVE